jgi:protein-disulfide isomerase
MHDLLFLNQGEIKSENIKEKVDQFASQIDNAYQVNAAPTLFINGERSQGVDSAAKLTDPIAKARKDAAPSRSH